MPRRNTPVRNPVAQSPLLRKGGPHVKSKTGERVRAKLSANSAIDDWLEEREESEQSDKWEQGSIGTDISRSPSDMNYYSLF